MISASYIEINTIGIVILFIIYLNIQTRKESFLLDRELFIAIMAATGVMLLTDTMMWVMNPISLPAARAILSASSVIYYMFHPLPGMLWSFYADYKIFGDRERLKKMIVPMLIPVAINTVCAVLSIFGNILFYIDDLNIYHRGKLLFITVIVTYFYLIYTASSIIRHKKELDKHNFYTLLAFAIPPFLGGILQLAVFGITLIWISTTFSLLIIFINIQNDQLQTDHLTGLYNRRQLDIYLNWHLRNENRINHLAGIMLDLNNFKRINDLYGHMVGDEALENAGLILKNSVRKKDFIARYGGDEFVIILETNDPIDVNTVIERIRINTEQFDRNNESFYKISFSIGYRCYDRESKITVQQFLKDIDAMMYQNKWEQKI